MCPYRLSVWVLGVMTRACGSNVIPRVMESMCFFSSAAYLGDAGGNENALASAIGGIRKTNGPIPWIETTGAGTCFHV